MQWELSCSMRTVRWTDAHDEANNRRLAQFLNAPKNGIAIPLIPLLAFIATYRKNFTFFFLCRSRKMYLLFCYLLQE